MSTENTVTQEQEFLLGRECAQAALSIGEGLTLIRKYEYVKHAYGTQAFFMLSIGIERLLKIILIYNHRRTNNNDFPDNAVLKSKGHKIKSMFDFAINIADEIGQSDIYEPLKTDPIYNLIIDFLTDFAHTSRYYNLDTLTGFPNSTNEPLREWNIKINKIIIERHYKHNTRKSEAIESLTSSIGENFLVSFDNEEGKKITNIKDFYLEGLTVDVKQKYSMFYVFCIVRFLSELLWHLDKNLYPFVSEYFVDFRQPDDAYVKRRKVWNLYNK